MARILKRRDFDVRAHICVTEEVSVVAASVSVDAESVNVEAESVKDDAASANVVDVSVKDDVAYVNDTPPTVYVPVFEPSAGSFANKKFL